MSEGGMNRRNAIRTITGGVAAGALFPVLGAKAADTRPNIVFILTDDHRYDAFGFMDKPWLKTPAMDSLAADGVQFVNSFVTTSLCSPSRASFLTGQYARCHGVKNNATPWRDSNVTFLEMLHARGYQSAFIGKWHMPGGHIPDLTAQGKVDRMVSFSYMTGQGRYYDCPLIVDGEKVKKDGYLTDILTDYALDFLDSTDRKSPFCLFLSHKAVHASFKPPRRYRGALRNAPLAEREENEKNLPQGLTNYSQVLEFHENQQGYYEALMAVDDSVGEVLEWLETRGLAENTIVVYTGDNGYFWGEHGLIDKRYAYEEGMRVPLLARYPRLMPGDETVDEMVLNIDLAPTLLEAAGIGRPAFMQGRSYLPLAVGRKTPWRDSFLYEYFWDPIQAPLLKGLSDDRDSFIERQVSKLGFPHPPIRAVRTENWKYITYLDENFSDELYNLSEDPRERNDLSGKASMRDKKERLRKELERLERKVSACG